MFPRLGDAARRHSLVAYFALAFVLTWIGSGVYLLSGRLAGGLLPAILAGLGVVVWYYGPALAAIMVTKARDGSVGVRQ